MRKSSSFDKGGRDDLQRTFHFHDRLLEHLHDGFVAKVFVHPQDA
jgi:hypothetical protein